MAQSALLTERRLWWSAFGSRRRYGLRPVPAQRADQYGMMISTQDVLARELARRYVRVLSQFVRWNSFAP